MPLTAFSKASGEELDVDQVIRRLAGSGDANTSKLLQAGIPDAWRQVIREDLECPSCFTLGADLVRDAISTQGAKRVVRQACFRYPIHLP